jgi:hypothetical protein
MIQVWCFCSAVGTFLIKVTFDRICRTETAAECDKKSRFCGGVIELPEMSSSQRMHSREAESILISDRAYTSVCTPSLPPSKALNGGHRPVGLGPMNITVLTRVVED